MSRKSQIVTLKAIAARARLAVATVSYALRNHPKIAEPTRRRVRAIAQEMGYRPNPRIASLMAHIRSAHSKPHGERIAFVWMHMDRAQSASDPFFKAVFEGAKLRAERAGFALEEYWTNDPGMTDRRLQQIIRSRGILGVVLSPVTSSEAAVTLDWDWSLTAAAVIGNVTWTPELHHAAHHHYLGMRLVLTELAKLGSRRPAAILNPFANERTKRAWAAAFLVHHPSPQKALRYVNTSPDASPAELAAWIGKTKPDALIVSDASYLESPAVFKLCARLPLVSLHWSPRLPRRIGGIDQRYDQVAAHAVDLVIAQLNSNELGAPDLPRIMLFPGQWVPPHLPASSDC